MSVAISSRRGEAGHGLGAGVPRPRAGAVPYLRLVPDQEFATAPDHDEVAEWPSQSEPQSQWPSPARSARVDGRHRPVRLTRRGRAVLWLLLLGAAVAAMALLAPASQAAAPSGPARTVTVHGGDTMWSIATQMLPGDSPNAAVDRIRVLNHLRDNEVYVGEQLLIPAK